MLTFQKAWLDQTQSQLQEIQCERQNNWVSKRHWLEDTGCHKAVITAGNLESSGNHHCLNQSTLLLRSNQPQ